MGPTSIGMDEASFEPSAPTLPDSNRNSSASTGTDFAGTDYVGTDYVGTDYASTDYASTDYARTEITGAEITGSGTAPTTPLTPARPVGRTKPGSASTKKSKKAAETPVEDAKSAGEESVPEPARPKFRPPRSRARRPEPLPFDQLQSDPTADGESPLAAGQPESESAEETVASKRGRRRRRRSGRETPKDSSKSRGPSRRLSDVAGWKLATAVLTTLAVLAVGWGMYQTTKLNRNQSQLQSSGATASQRISGLENRLSAVESNTASQLAALQQQLTDFTEATASDQDSAKEQYAKVEQAIPVTATDFESAVAQVSTLSAAYLTAKAAADAAPADQAARIKSLEAKSALLANCAKVWTGATQQIFNAENPQKAMADVGKDLAGAASGCKVITQ